MCMDDLYSKSPSGSASRKHPERIDREFFLAAPEISVRLKNSIFTITAVTNLSVTLDPIEGKQGSTETPKKEDMSTVSDGKKAAGTKRAKWHLGSLEHLSD